MPLLLNVFKDPNKLAVPLNKTQINQSITENL